MKHVGDEGAAATSLALRLRRQAEEQLRITGEDMRHMSASQIRRLVYELQLTQLELQLQNEELQRAQADLEKAHSRYQYLYDYAPVGYLTVGPDGVILEANLTAAIMLHTEREQLVRTILTRLVATDARDALYLHLQHVASEADPQSFDICIPQASEPPLWLRLETVAERGARGVVTQYRMVMSDITARKQAEATQQQLMQQLLEVQENERRHLARELHDEAMQSLTALQMNLDLLGDEHPTLLSPLTRSMGLVDDLVEQIRTLSLELRPLILDELGLGPALEWYCQRQVPKLGLQAHYTCDPALPRPNATVETTYFRIVQEAVTNVAKHARTSEIWINLHRKAATLYLTIRDQGVGFDLQNYRRRAAQGGGVGLRGMMERMQVIGGRLDIRSTPGRGTEIHVQVTLPPREI